MARTSTRDGTRPHTRRAITLIVTASTVWVAAAVWLDRHGQGQVAEGKWDAIVVAGCKVRPDGSPSRALARRTAAATQLWRRGLAPQIIFTGGLGDHPPTEAAVAAAHARSLGVPAEAIVEEDRSTSTEENARFAAQVTGARRVIVVTDSYHVFRSRRVFARHFGEVVGHGSVPLYGPRIKGALREVAAVVFYGLKGRL